MNFKMNYNATINKFILTIKMILLWINIISIIA